MLTSKVRPSRGHRVGSREKEADMAELPDPAILQKELYAIYAALCALCDGLNIPRPPHTQ